MYRINIKGQTFSYRRVGRSVQDSVNTEEVQFTFDSSWDGLTIFACFKNSSLPEESQEKHLAMPSNNTVFVPWEMYTVDGALFVGALGLKDDKVVKPTVWVQLSTIEKGVDPNGEFAGSFTPSVAEQVIAIAQSVRDDADAGKFNGKAGKSPRIAKNGNWEVWDDAESKWVDTGVYSGGDAPHIGENGNWFVGSTDTGVSATGPQGLPGTDGQNGQPGVPGKSVVYGELVDSAAASDSRSVIGGLIANQIRFFFNVKNASAFKVGDIVVVPGQYNDAPRVHYMMYCNVAKVTGQKLEVYAKQVIEDGASGSAGTPGSKVMAAKQGGLEQQPEANWDILGKYGQDATMRNIFNAPEFLPNDIVIIAGLTTDTHKRVSLFGRVVSATAPSTVRYITIGYIKDGASAVVDSTLSKAGQAADAAKTGEAVRQLNESLTDKVAISGLTPATPDMTQQVGYNVETKKLVTKPGSGSGGPLEKLTFTGAVTAEYDGTQPVTVAIPTGGGTENPPFPKLVHKIELDGKETTRIRLNFSKYPSGFFVIFRGVYGKKKSGVEVNLFNVGTQPGNITNRVSCSGIQVNDKATPVWGYASILITNVGTITSSLAKTSELDALNYYTMSDLKITPTIRSDHDVGLEIADWNGLVGGSIEVYSDVDVAT